MSTENAKGESAPTSAPPAEPGAAPRPQAQAPAGPAKPAAADDRLYHGSAMGAAYFVDYVKWSMVCVLGVGLAYLANTYTPLAGAGWVWVLSLAGVPGLLWTWLVARTTKFRIDRRRVETEAGVLTKSIDSFELWRVLDVQYTQTVLDRILGLATITLISTDQTHPKLALHGLPDHRKLFEQLREAVQLARHTNRPMEFVHGHDANPNADFTERMR